MLLTHPKDKALGTANPSRGLAKALVKNLGNGYEMHSSGRAGGLVCLQVCCCFRVEFNFFLWETLLFNPFTVSLAALQQLSATDS